MDIPEKLEKKIIPRNSIPDYLKTSKGPIVFTNGCFDIIHRGHVSYLLSARELGNFLWIGLNSDSSVKKLKGPNRPVNNEINRAVILASLFFVDAITIFEEDTPVQLLDEIKPDIHVKGGDYIKEKLPEYETVVKNGGKVEILKFIEGESTTNIINKVKENS
ncbi:MAG: D-glycero-beta-D-manno-heptose 1-phosphate adenylyltransferase [Leptospiraceae bacterium]|nr:D-glycero-beta-D-manno-heptose 1-phosphate adenylyltransferase [Leptospiraceae bacterium]